MEGDSGIDLHNIPLQALTRTAHTRLSCLLNPTKVLLSEVTNNLLRDWRGLANLTNIPSDITNAFEGNKTANVLKYWIQRRDGTATIGQLLEYMERMDRFDVFDDFMDLLVENGLFLNQQARQPNQQVALRGHTKWYHHQDNDENIITFDDKRHGCPQSYHGYILYAKEDREFAMEMVERMRAKNYKLCTEEDILPLHTTLYAPIARLISSGRCHWIIPIYSEDFLKSSANKFFSEYMQALSMESRRPRNIPCLYRECQLPPLVSSTLVLYCNSNMYNFWERLAASLQIPDMDGSNDTTDPISAMNITELESENCAAAPSNSKSRKRMSHRFRRWSTSLMFWKKSRAIVPYLNKSRNL